MLDAGPNPVPEPKLDPELDSELEPECITIPVPLRRKVVFPLVLVPAPVLHRYWPPRAGARLGKSLVFNFCL
jgi:hypothetical protein